MPKTETTPDIMKEAERIARNLADDPSWKSREYFEDTLDEWITTIAKALQSAADKARREAISECAHDCLFMIRALIGEK